MSISRSSVRSGSREGSSQTPEMVITRPRAYSEVSPHIPTTQSSVARRQRRVSQAHRRISQTTIPRKRRDSRHSLQTAIQSADRQLHAVKELERNTKIQGYFDKNVSKLELFRRASKIIRLFASLCLYCHQNEKSKTELTKHTVFTEYLKEEEQEKTTLQTDLYFDFTHFKANRKMYVTAETKHVLSLPSVERTEQQVAKVKYWLSHIQAFAEYPRRMQQKLIQVGWYEGHVAKRVLIRQGHRPQAFYFLLSGSAVVTVIDKKTQISRTVHFLRRGDSFGELAILHDTVRQSTIITREFSEVLVISKEDFVDIFMASRGVKTITDPDHNDFIRSIGFLKEWPIDLLSVNPKRCLFHFFRRGSVLVKDSNRSDWIYIIKSGSCRVLKKLKRVQSRLTEHQQRVIGFERVSSHIKKSTQPFNKLRLTISALSAFKPRNNDRGCDNCINETNFANKSRDGDYSSAEDDIIDKVAKDRETAKFGRRSSEREEVANEKTSKTSRESSVGFPSVSKKNVRNHGANAWLKLRSGLKKKRNLHTGIENKSDVDNEEILPLNKLSFLDEEEPKKEEVTSSVDYNSPVFIEVASLTKGDTFGVNYMIFEEQPSVSLVSNGAECIVISKKFFLNHCTEKMKRRLLLEEQPYPDDETFQRRLQNKINWESFKTKTLSNTINYLTPD